MGTDLMAVKDELHSLPRVQVLRDVLAPYRLPVEAWRAGLLQAFETNSPLKWVNDLQSVVSSAITIAVLGLRMDRATGQSCIVPFAGKAQPIVMVQGYTVVAGRGGFVMQSRLIREGDEWQEIAGSAPGIQHAPKHQAGAKAIGVYAIARSSHHPTLFTPVMMLDEVIAVRDRSKGYQAAKDNGNPHPWSTDFEAMMLKTPKRRLQKDIPNDQLAQAAYLDTMHDMGRLSYLSPDGHAIEAEAPEIILPARQAGVSDAEDLTQDARPPPPIEWGMGGKDDRLEGFADVALWQRWLLGAIDRVSDAKGLAANFERNRARLEDFEKHWPDAVAVVRQAFKAKGIT